MKWIFYIVLLISLPAVGQNFHTNRPEMIYPAVEKFIAENYARKTPVLQKLQKIDSIIVQTIPLVKNRDGTYGIVYGKTYFTGKTMWIKISPFVAKYPSAFEQVFIHELGHVVGLGHIDVEGRMEDDPVRDEIMAHPRSFVITAENFYRVREKYYDDVHRMIMKEINNKPLTK